MHISNQTDRITRFKMLAWNYMQHCILHHKILQGKRKREKGMKSMRDDDHFDIA